MAEAFPRGPTAFGQASPAGDVVPLYTDPGVRVMGIVGQARNEHAVKQAKQNPASLNTTNLQLIRPPRD